MAKLMAVAARLVERHNGGEITRCQAELNFRNETGHQVEYNTLKRMAEGKFEGK
jgi:hypothetical protein